MPSGRPAALLHGAVDGSGAPCDVLVGPEAVLAVGAEAGAHPLAAEAQRLDLTGWCLLPAPAEPHAHLDKAFLAGRCGHTEGDVRGAVRAMAEIHSSMTVADIAGRARRAAQLALSHGFTALRSHVDVGGGVGTRGAEALVSLREELAGLLDLQLVALPVQPVSGRDGAEGRHWLTKALELGLDAVGGGPWLDVDPAQAVDELTAAAAGSGLPVDLHVDESTELAGLTLERFVSRVEHLGLGGRAIASHCVALGQQPAARALELARHMQRAGVAVITLPQSNLYLQGRGYPTGAPRGLAPLSVLDEAGVLVAAGGDNWRDPFNPLGRADPMETAALLVASAHVTAARAYDMVSVAARAVMGARPARVRPGDGPDLLAIRADDVGDAVAGATEERMVVRSGRVVARTEVRRSLEP